jgi:predicted nucleotidyltransferase
LPQEGPNTWVRNLSYLTYHGSTIYGTQVDISDIDFYGFAVPSNDYMNQWLSNSLIQDKNFHALNQWQKHHVQFEHSQLGQIEMDVTIYNYYTYLSLCFDQNPNMIESLFTKDEDCLILSNVAKKVRSYRREFLSKLAYHRFLGFANGQRKSIEKSRSANNNNRKDLIDNYGYDVKFAGHMIRMALQTLEILSHRDLTLDQNKDLILQIRRGEFKLEELLESMRVIEEQAKTLYETSEVLPYELDIKALKNKLLDFRHDKLWTYPR